MSDPGAHWDKAPWKRARKRAISPQEADRIAGKLRTCDRSNAAIAEIANEHQLSQLTIRKIAQVRNIQVPPP